MIKKRYNLRSNWYKKTFKLWFSIYQPNLKKTRFLISYQQIKAEQTVKCYIKSCYLRDKRPPHWCGVSGRQRIMTAQFFVCRCDERRWQESNKDREKERDQSNVALRRCRVRLSSPLQSLDPGLPPCSSVSLAWSAEPRLIVEELTEL